jgi:HAD superfamily hydrolase (TIGR01484 family)
VVKLEERNNHQSVNPSLPVNKKIFYKEKYKAFISDFDGTLVGPDLRFTPRVASALQSILKSNIFLSIASGRPYIGPLEKVSKQLNLQTPLITRGGAEIVDPQTGEILKGNYMVDTYVKNIIAYLLEIKVNFIVEKDNHIYTLDGKLRDAYGIERSAFRKVNRLVVDKIPKIHVVAPSNLEEEQKVEDTFKNRITF